MSGWLVIGVGNGLRGDDAAGIQAAKALERLKLPGVQVLESGGEGLDLMEAWTDSDRVIVIDAAHSGAPAGTLHFFDAQAGLLPASLSGGSTHMVGLAEAIELSRALDHLPAELLVYGIEGKSFEMGEALSPAVEEAIPKVIQQIQERVGRENHA